MPGPAKGATPLTTPTRSCTRKWLGVCAAVMAFGAATGGIVGCGDSEAGSVTVARIGNDAISRSTLDHWIGVIKHSAAFVDLRGAPRGTPKEQALALLISSHWLISEAARQGVAVSAGALKDGLSERKREVADFPRYLRETGQTLAGIKFEVTAELAAEALRQKLARRAGRVTPHELVRFYRHNPQLFTTERRITELIEGLNSVAEATALVRRVGSGTGFAKVAFHEGVTHSAALMRTGEKAQLVNAIFTTPPGVVSRPLLVTKSWALFLVRRVIPGRVEPYADVREDVILRLRESRERLLAREFDRSYKAYWEARTSCSAGYVGPGCPQFGKPLGVYEDPFSTKEGALPAEPMDPSPL
jgi:hypothetical protein